MLQQNVTLKQLGQDGDCVDTITRKIVKAVEQVGKPPALEFSFTVS
jgi:hypothetical protein